MPEPHTPSRDDVDAPVEHDHGADPSLSPGPDTWLVPDAWETQPGVTPPPFMPPPRPTIPPTAPAPIVGTNAYQVAPPAPGRPAAAPQPVDVDAMTWREFEVAMATAFEGRGWEVTFTKDGADGGVDLILYRPGEHVYVQCKHYNVYTVGVKVVRELYGVMVAEGASGAIVATTGRFTKEAYEFADGVGVQLLDGRDVRAMLGAMTGTAPAGVLGASGAPAAFGVPRCPRCGEPMVLRTSRRGTNAGQQFWGCPRFPACRGLVAIEHQQPTRLVPAGPGPRQATRPTAPTGRPTSAPRGRARRRPSRVAALLLAVPLIVLVPLVGGTMIVNAITRPLQRIAGAAPIALPGLPAPVDKRVVATIPVSMKPEQLAVDAKGKRLYATHPDESSVTIIDTATREVVSTVKLKRRPGAIAFDSKTKTLWIVNPNDASVTVTDRNGAPRALIKVGEGPVGVAVDPGRGRAFVTNSVDKTVSLINTSTRRVTATRKPGWPLGAAVVDPAKHHVCLANHQALRMWYCYDASTLKFVGVNGPGGDSIAVDSVTHDRYAIRSDAKTLYVVDATTKKQTAIPAGQTPTSVTVDSTTHHAYVADHDAKTILVIDPGK